MSMPATFSRCLLDVSVHQRMDGIAELVVQWGTLQHYECNEAHFVQATLNAGVNKDLEVFAELLPDNAQFLNVGGGSGENALWFMQLGFLRRSIYASPAMVRATSARANVAAELRRIADLGESDSYDGICCCGEPLHVASIKQGEVWRRLLRAFRPGGALYASYKLGDGDRVAEDGRYFFDTNVAALTSQAISAGFINIRDRIAPCITRRSIRWCSLITQKGRQGSKAQEARPEEAAK